MEHKDLNNLIALAVAEQLFLFQFRTSDHMGVKSMIIRITSWGLRRWSSYSLEDGRSLERLPDSNK
ncbi:hypothetical protein DY000_02018395 [Brassica cretica]|uniref:Uncharacterized protein n=1 Tax=Brassica cretica TaxID=69181 RepID=A0ABQ7D006_BRACR|nr:hypothetical protein DY000_02018395 [Brassica cretica]